MNKKITYYNDDARYTDAPLDVEEAFARSVRIKDFLPSPEELVFKTNASNIKTQKSQSYSVLENVTAML